MRKSFKNSGYSMISLVIALVVILILSVVSISRLSTNRLKNQMMNFIYDMNAVQDKVQDYYVEKGTLPTKATDKINIEDVSTYMGSDDSEEEFRSQLSNYDDEDYYKIDFAQLGAISLKPFDDSDIYSKTFIVNGGSLKVYVLNGIDYKSETNSLTQRYYTLTADIVSGQDPYFFQDEEIIIVGNPISWVDMAKIRVVLPRRSIADNWNGWTFKWDHGPRKIEDMKALGSKNIFNYGDPLVVRSNGIYTIYAQDNNGKETLLNVNVSKIDDVKPKFELYDDNTKLTVKDDETGIKNVMYKTLERYNQNKNEASSVPDGDSATNTSVDIYLLDGSGDDAIVDLKNEIADYVTKKKEIFAKIEAENDSYTRWLSEHPIDGILVTQEDVDRAAQTHISAIDELNRQSTELDEKYPYLADLEGTTEKSKLVLYVEDCAGNSIVVGENGILSTETLADSFNISLDEIKALQ